MVMPCAKNSRKGENLKMIRPSHFHDLLDCLAGQFFNTQSARCCGNEFGLQISLPAKDFFSVAIIPTTLPLDKVVLGVLSDDSAKIATRNGFTFTIYIDLGKIEGPAFKILSLIIIAHEICHFAYYYELFIRLGGTTGIRVQNSFKYEVSDKLIDAVTEEHNGTFETYVDEHNIEELIETFGRYDKKHFARGSGTLIDYFSFFRDFLDHQDLSSMLKELEPVPPAPTDTSH